MPENILEIVTYFFISVFSVLSIFSIFQVRNLYRDSVKMDGLLRQTFETIDSLEAAKKEIGSMLPYRYNLGKVSLRVYFKSEKERDIFINFVMPLKKNANIVPFSQKKD